MAYYKNLGSVFDNYGFWLNHVEEVKEKGSGYTETDATKFLTITHKELTKLYSNGIISILNITNIPTKVFNDNDKFAIRVYEKKIRISHWDLEHLELDMIMLLLIFHL